jgi:hypothetical protein
MWAAASPSKEEREEGRRNRNHTLGAAKLEIFGRRYTSLRYYYFTLMF